MTTVKVKVPKKPVAGTVSNDEIVRIARARAKATLAAAGKPIRQQGNRQAQQEMGAAEGLAAAFAPISKQILDMYTAAGRDTASLGQGYSADMRARLQAAGQNSDDLVAAQGLPVAPGGQDAANAAANVSYGIGGDMPAASMYLRGAEYGRAAAYLPATARLQGFAQAATTRQKTQDALDALAAKYPQVFDQYLTGERNWKNSQFDNYTNYLNTQRGYGAGAKPKISIRPDGTIVSIDPYTGVATVTGQTTPSSTTPADKAAAARTKARAAAVAKRGAAVDKMQLKLTTDINKMMGRMKKVTKPGLNGPVSTNVPDPPTMREARNYMFNQMYQALRRFGYTKAHVREMVDELLATWPPDRFKQTDDSRDHRDYPGR